MYPPPSGPGWLPPPRRDEDDDESYSSREDNFWLFLTMVCFGTCVVILFLLLFCHFVGWVMRGAF